MFLWVVHKLVRLRPPLLRSIGFALVEVIAGLSLELQSLVDSASLLKHLIGQHNDSANVLVYNSTCVRHLPKRKFKFTEGDSVHPVQFEEHDLQGFTFVLEINICPK